MKYLVNIIIKSYIYFLFVLVVFSGVYAILKLSNIL